MSTNGPASASVCLYYHPDARATVAAFGDAFELVERSEAPEDLSGFFLWAAADHLELRRGCDRHGVHVSLAELGRRRAQGSALLRACTAGGNRLRVLDAMAGFGVDGLLIAGRGHAVTLVERHPIVHALQRDLVRRSAIVGVECRCGDAFETLCEEPPFDVVYLDPMFPAHRTGALPGKRMQWLAELTRPDPRPQGEWIDLAVPRARMRVVLKRRRKDPPVRVPDWQILGRTVRYDVYRGRAAQDSWSTA